MLHRLLLVPDRLIQSICYQRFMVLVEYTATALYNYDTFCYFLFFPLAFNTPPLAPAPVATSPHKLSLLYLEIVISPSVIGHEVEFNAFLWSLVNIS